MRNDCVRIILCSLGTRINRILIDKWAKHVANHFPVNVFPQFPYFTVHLSDFVFENSAGDMPTLGTCAETQNRIIIN